MFDFSELLGMFIVPIAFLLFSFLKLIIKKISVYLLMAPVTTYAIHYIFSHVFLYSPLAYLGLTFTILGIFLLFYNFRRNIKVSFIQFWRRTLVMYSKIAILIWFILAIYQVIHYIIV